MTLANGEPIEGLTVSLENSRNNFETITDQTGYYVFDNVPVGTWDISIKQAVGQGWFILPLETFSVTGGSSGNIYQKNFTFVLITP